jgi:hypothetical protein
LFTNGVSDGKIWSINITAKYRQKKSVSVSICIRQVFGSDAQAYSL